MSVETLTAYFLIQNHKKFDKNTYYPNILIKIINIIINY